jgi:hypothetical protein
VLRHDVQPGRLVAGFFLTVTAVVYAGDAGGTWEAPWFVAIPLVTVGLCLAGASALLTRTLRRHRSSSRAGHGPKGRRASEAGGPGGTE